MEQNIISTNGRYEDADAWFDNMSKVMLVCDKSIIMHKINDYFETLFDRLGVGVIRFSDFSPNPLYESVVKGVKTFRENKCDAIIALGGGSAMDVAKCIKAYCFMNGDGDNGEWLKQEIEANDIRFLAVPTTAGTGSEATRYAVVYYNGEKQSVTSETFIPDTVLMDSSILKTLPVYFKKATMCDALCHAIESYWSVNSTDESKEYSKNAIDCILKNMDGYISNTEEGNAGMLLAANLAGKAINITQTTAGHAMCYKITSLFGLAHGHAAILCDRILYSWMIDNVDRCSDPRGSKYLADTLDDIGIAMGCDNAKAGAKKLVDIFERLELEIPVASEQELVVLKKGVNPVRLKNHPIEMDENTIDRLYHLILNGDNYER
ncbi:MAG: phosphonoacetaldehyde reductase [Eubacterium sp.]|nr:phosphonoacetaldehyde reductase [Eubacterium sp.]